MDRIDCFLTIAIVDDTDGLIGYLSTLFLAEAFDSPCPYCALFFLFWEITRSISNDMGMRVNDDFDRR